MTSPHVLVITGEEEIDREYDIECPGVTDACRMWIGCACPESTDSDRLWDDPEAHGVEHRNIDDMWATPTDQCYVVALACQSDAADDLVSREHLGPGRYAVDHDYAGEGWYNLDLAVPVEPAGDGSTHG